MRYTNVDRDTRQQFVEIEGFDQTARNVQIIQAPCDMLISQLYYTAYGDLFHPPNDGVAG